MHIHYVLSLLTSRTTCVHARTDEASMRLNRQLSSAGSLFQGHQAGQALLLDGDTVLLDPMANTPLKIHEADIRQLGSKECLESLPLRLTAAENAIIEKSGSVLVLGRSGTGKTICIANKMMYDQRTRICGQGRQLFVCRSARVCALVQRLQHFGTEREKADACSQGSNGPIFMQLDQLVNHHITVWQTCGCCRRITRGRIEFKFWNF